MNRRRFLTFIALSAAIQSAAGCRGSAAGEKEALPEFDPSDPLGSTLARARAMGKPLLVLTIPKGGARVHKPRGARLGDWLNRCSDEALLDLALCEVVAADTTALSVLVEGVGESRGESLEPWMWLVHTSNPLECAEPIGLAGVDGKQAFNSEERVAALSRGLADALFSGGRSIQDYADGSRVAGGREAERFESALLGREALRPSVQEIGHFAAIARSKASSFGEAERAQTFAHLILSARMRVREQPPAGARWASYRGSCGGILVVEGEPEGPEPRLMVQCGMGHNPEYSSRFLTFYSRG